MKENSINEKEVDEVDNVIKISIPIISNQEIENIINTEGLYDKIAEQIYHDREMIILQEFIKKLQKENEELKQDRNNNYQNYIIKKQIEKYKTYIEQLRRELGQKDKIIDLMAETINNHDIDEDVCKQMGKKANCNEFEDTEKCKECIKQYFNNKAKEIK